ncbi:hypothetical protein PAXRUDRAFT_609008 [Paxillus rubicundulus Ve08.2h10]|uniref:Uncharacterized protein n=1 Tax=Paxillus rubicundulus Ve08.2h10 TaxID=930991 RepID=A0A0D0E3X2_9AGAM|nr:hypothetical protein PAXRUDRAFT_609008 [Paxillus rubicundulus Ve08.2h10]
MTQSLVPSSRSLFPRSLPESLGLLCCSFEGFVSLHLLIMKTIRSLFHRRKRRAVDHEQLYILQLVSVFRFAIPLIYWHCDAQVGHYF